MASVLDDFLSTELLNVATVATTATVEAPEANKSANCRKSRKCRNVAECSPDNNGDKEIKKYPRTESTDIATVAALATPDGWYGEWYNAKVVGKTVGGVLVTTTVDASLCDTPDDPALHTCSECARLWKGKYCKSCLLFRRDYRLALAPHLDRPWRCPSFQKKATGGE